MAVCQKCPHCLNAMALCITYFICFFLTCFFLIPDKNMMNGRLQGISAFPETFFVDKNGNIVGETYSGSHTLEEWKEIVEKELSAIKENN